MQVVLGGVDIQRDEVYDQVIPVEKAIVHEDYKQSPFALHNDVGELQRQQLHYTLLSYYIYCVTNVPFFTSCAAMLQLRVMDRPYCAKETRFVKTACLPNQPFNSGTECVISGWGVTETRKHHLNQKITAQL